MMKKFAYIMTLTAALLLGSCHLDNLDDTLPKDEVPEGYVEINFDAFAPAMEVVETRAVDPDGVDVQTLSLFCFNEYGLFLTIEQAQLTRNTATSPSVSGTYKATIPEDAYIIHFVANQNPELFTGMDFSNQTEDEINDDMVGASGMIIYWARFERSYADNAPSLGEQLAAMNGGEGVKLLRNQAKVTVEADPASGFTVTGFNVANILAFGTTAPYHSVNRFPTAGSAFEWPGDEPWVTLPKNLTKMSDIDEVTTKPEEYIFEHPNTLEDPVSVIIRGRNQGESQDSYYRVMIMDAKGEQVMIRRNHHYRVNVIGKLTYGSATFEEAMLAPPTNNVYVAVDDWVNEITFGDYTLNVNTTGIVLDESQAGGVQTFTYTVSASGSTNITDDDKAEVSWMTGNNIAAHNFNHTFSIDASRKVGTGVITVQLLDIPASEQALEGTLLVKHGRLQRKIEMHMIRNQSFVPSWVGTQIYGGTTGEFVTIKFTIPETCPDILFPFPIYISVNSLDVRSAAGQDLPIVIKGEEGYYGDDNGLGYKYEFVVTEPGVQRVYFHNILEAEDGETDNITLEAPYFEKLVKEFAYVNHQNIIGMRGMHTYNATADGEEIYYTLVPRKINAPVAIQMQLQRKGTPNNTPINAAAADEFILYSKTLNAYKEGYEYYNANYSPAVDVTNLVSKPAGITLQQDFYPQLTDDDHSSDGRTLPFKPHNPSNPSEGTGNYTVYLYTNRANSADVVRIASNSEGMSSIIPPYTATYNSNTYRSLMFELANYHPFGFAAEVQIGGVTEGTWGNNNSYPQDNTGVFVEPIDNLHWSYVPNQQVDILLDITHFIGSDGVEVDPFGTEFEVFIDAPMLEIDASRLAANRLNSSKLVKISDGKFKYIVDADRATEAGFGALAAATSGVAGERKVLPFKTTKSTTKGEIKIYTDANKVVFYDKTFNVDNVLIEGYIGFKPNGGAVSAIKKDEFVSFSLAKTGVRIGSMVVDADGHFKVNLRGEYEFGWNDSEEIHLEYVDITGAGSQASKIYHAHIEDLAEFYEMALSSTPANPIILTEEEGQ
ncbi:MAG: hypothetical protein J6Q40_07065 [Tidjanibacter sp.]|nr:hypothetical protein [Tidjanibacter sp.]